MFEPTMGDASRSHRVFAVVDNHQVEHQGTIFKAICTLYGISSLVLFDLGASNSFISPSHVQRCGLVETQQVAKWKVKIATSSKVVTDCLVSGCVLDLGAFTTTVDLHILLLGSYDIVLGMDWLAFIRKI